jgi:hypothetical protein
VAVATTVAAAVAAEKKRVGGALAHSPDAVTGSCARHCHRLMRLQQLHVRKMNGGRARMCWAVVGWLAHEPQRFASPVRPVLLHPPPRRRHGAVGAAVPGGAKKWRSPLVGVRWGVDGECVQSYYCAWVGQAGSRRSPPPAHTPHTTLTRWVVRVRGGTLLGP